MHFNDLTLYEYYTSFPWPNVRNVGWLDHVHIYSVGEVPPGFVEKLGQVIAGSAQVDVHVNKIRGIHPCSLCGADRIAISAHHGGSVMLGSSEIWIPSMVAGDFFASPSMILHYVQDHRYVPPQAYVDAVLSMDLAAPYNAQLAYEDLYAKEQDRLAHGSRLA